MKKLITNYTFVPGSVNIGYITFNDYNSSNPFDLTKLVSILNTRTGKYLYDASTHDWGSSVDRGVITNNNRLELSQQLTKNLNLSTDKLQIWIEESDTQTAGGEMSIGNVESTLQDSFGSGDLSKWDITVGTGDIVNVGGNAAGAAYLRIIKPVDKVGSVTSVVSKKTFSTPVKVEANLSVSNRLSSQESGFELVGVDDSSNIEFITNRPLLTPSAIQVFTLSTLTITFATKHNIRGTERVFLTGNAVSLLNIGPAVATVVNPYQITVPINNSVAVNTYSVGSSVVQVIEHSQAKNTLGIYFASTATTQADFIVRDSGSMRASVGQTIATSTANSAATSPVTDAILSGSKYTLNLNGVSANVGSKSSDSTGQSNSLNRFDDITPDNSKKYKIRFRSTNYPSMSYVKTTIQSITKSGSNVATVTTSTPHGFTTANNWIAIYGVMDQVNFTNISTVQITSIVNTTQFTVAFGTSATASSSGGTIAILQSAVSFPTFFNGAIQSMSATDNILTIIMNAAASGATSGEAWQICGMTGAAASYNGIYKVLRMIGNNFELEKFDGSAITTTTSITTGGSLIRNTEYRIHNVVAEQYTYIRTQLSEAGSTDQNNVLPVSVVNSPAVTATQGGGTSSSMWSTGGFSGLSVGDIVSAALTATNTSGSITPGILSNIGAHSHVFYYEISTITGTAVTVDLVIQGSVNGGEWHDVYHFPRITTSGTYYSPKIEVGDYRQLRYVRTVGGSSPSITGLITRMMFSQGGRNIKQFYNYGILSMNATGQTNNYYIAGTRSMRLEVRMGAVTTTAPVGQWEVSDDGTNFTLIGTAVTCTANSVNIQNVTTDHSFLRFRVTTAGSGATLNYLFTKASD